MWAELLFEATFGWVVVRATVILKSLIPLHLCLLGDRTAKSHYIELTRKHSVSSTDVERVLHRQGILGSIMCAL